MDEEFTEEQLQDLCWMFCSICHGKRENCKKKYITGIKDWLQRSPETATPIYEEALQYADLWKKGKEQS